MEIAIQLFTLLFSFGALLISALVYWSEKRKTFEDQLFSIKTQRYDEIQATCYQIWINLDPVSEPYDNLDPKLGREHREAFFQLHINPHFEEVFKLDALKSKAIIYLPFEIIQAIDEYYAVAARFLTEAVNFDTTSLIKLHDLLTEKYYHILDLIRSDLKVDHIAKGLNSRLSISTIQVNKQIADKLAEAIKKAAEHML